MIKLGNIDDNYIISLSALLHSAYLVNKIATTGQNCPNESEMLIRSIYATDTFDTKFIYKNYSELHHGYLILKKILTGNTDIPLITMQKYALNMILIQKNINKIKDLKFLIRKKIDNYQENSMIATNLSDLIAYTEEIYKEYIGIIRPRVVVSGKKEYLERNSSLIRALLLSGIRAAFLWDYYGGSKWQLMFRRKEILNKCEDFFI